MKTIKHFDSHNLRNDEHCEFLSKVDNLVVQFSPELLGIVDQYLPFKTKLTNEENTLAVERGSNNTKLIVAADRKRDRTHRGFELQVEANSFHWLPEMAEAASRVGKIVGQYGNLRNVSYNEESRGIASLIKELRAEPYSADLDLLALTAWLDQLETDNNNFRNIFDDRANEEIARASGNVRTARIEVNPTYEAIVQRINALVEVNGEAAYAEFIDKVNYHIDYYKNTLATRKGRKEKDEKPEA